MSTRPLLPTLSLATSILPTPQNLLCPDLWPVHWEGARGRGACAREHGQAPWEKPVGVGAGQEKWGQDSCRRHQGLIHTELRHPL